MGRTRIMINKVSDDLGKVIDLYVSAYEEKYKKNAGIVLLFDILQRPAVFEKNQRKLLRYLDKPSRFKEGFTLTGT